MTEEQRDKGRITTLTILLIVLFFGMCSACTPLLYKSDKIRVTHVLTLTNDSDTCKIKLYDIDPNKIYHVIGYDFVRVYENRYYNPYQDYLYDDRKSPYKYRYLGDVNGEFGSVYFNNQKVADINNYVGAGKIFYNDKCD